MNTCASDPKADHMVSNQVDNDLEPECENRFDSGKYEQLSESGQFDFRSEAEKGSCPTFLLDHQKGDHKSDSEKEKYKSELEKDDYKYESGKADFKTESEDSDLESERSQNGSDVYDRLNEIEITGCGDGIIESHIPAYDESPKDNVTLRRGRGFQNAETFMKGSKRDMCQFDLWQAKDNAVHFKKSDFPCDVVPGAAVATGNNSTSSAASFKAWFKYIAPKTMCLIILSLVYLGFTIFGIKVLNFSPNST